MNKYLNTARLVIDDVRKITFVFYRFQSGNVRRIILKPAEVCDLLKGFLLIVCTILMCYIDTNMMYHLVKSQSVMKLYIFYNMLEVGDRLFSAFGQDTIDALFWTATEPRDRRREHLGVIPHLIFALVYVCILFICDDEYLVLSNFSKI